VNGLRFISAAAAIIGASIAAPVSYASAELVLSQLVIDLSPGDHSRTDIEIWNRGADRSFVSVEPREIIAPGTASESSKRDPDPEELGLLVSPARLVLEPGQRRLIRIAAIAPPSDRERVYRVTVRPVVGQLSSEASGLKVLVGYDLLVLVRPDNPNPHVAGQRAGDRLLLRNDGNVSVELGNGQRCSESTHRCAALPGGRLYVGQEKEVSAPASEQVRYEVKAGPRILKVEF
jgi:P pilus assembly chaperone PapD